MDRVSSDLVGLMSRDTACPPALRQRPVLPGDGKDAARLVEGQSLGGQLVAANAGDGLALEGGRGVLDADDSAHPGGQ
jgi:hypothetical protein